MISQTLWMGLSEPSSFGRGEPSASYLRKFPRITLQRTLTPRIARKTGRDSSFVTGGFWICHNLHCKTWDSRIILCRTACIDVKTYVQTRCIGVYWKLCGSAVRSPKKTGQFYGMSNPSSSRTLLTCTSAFGWQKERDAQAAAFTEQSETANEELLLFFFQLDLTTRLQRALNMDQYEAAQQLREKLVEVDKELLRMTETKLGLASSKDEAQDKAITILRLRNDLQTAVEAEDYVGAAKLRDKISKLEGESLAAAARAMAYQNVQYLFRLGQRVVHQKFGYRGVVCGMDPLCTESDVSSRVQDLSRGKNQPFYQVLVDMRAEPNLLVAYVAEENLMPPREPDKDSFEHPYVSFLFYGMDSAGDFIPIKQLREKYNQPRHELPWEEDGTSDGAGDAKP